MNFSEASPLEALEQDHAEVLRILELLAPSPPVDDGRAELFQRLKVEFVGCPVVDVGRLFGGPNRRSDHAA